nr:DUF6338 family protein [Actinomycetota bacterium]
MIPGGVVGLLLFVVAVAPGYVYLRVAERFETRPDRSQLLEAAELVVIGAVVTTITALVAVILGAVWPGLFVDVSAWAKAGAPYLRNHPYTTAWSLGFVIFAGCGVAAGFALLAHHRRDAELVPGGT